MTSSARKAVEIRQTRRSDFGANVSNGRDIGLINMKFRVSTDTYSPEFREIVPPTRAQRSWGGTLRLNRALVSGF